MEYSIQLSKTFKEFYIVSSKGEIIETFTNIEKASAKLKELEFRQYLIDHEGMTYIYEYGKIRFNLGLIKDGWFMDCIDYKNEKTVRCTQYYKNGVLPSDKSYHLLSETKELDIIEKTITEKIEDYNKWKKIGDKNLCCKISNELTLLNNQIEYLKK